MSGHNGYDTAQAINNETVSRDDLKRMVAQWAKTDEANAVLLGQAAVAVCEAHPDQGDVPLYQVLAQFCRNWRDANHNPVVPGEVLEAIRDSAKAANIEGYPPNQVFGVAQVARANTAPLVEKGRQ